MAPTHRLIEWTDAHRDIALDLIRIYLGIGLFVRGWWFFVLNASELTDLVGEMADTTFVSATLVHYVALAHFGGGLLMALGLLTRVAALVQIPVLIGAVFFVHLGEGLLASGQSLEFSALVLFLLVVIFFHGSGRLSLDYYLFERGDEHAVRGAQTSLFESAREAEAARRVQREARAPVAAGVASERMPERVPEHVRASEPVPHTIPDGCTCEFTRDRNDPRVRAERRYGMRALRFLTGTTGRPREIVFRCADCGNVVEVSTDVHDIAQYRYR